MTVAQWAELLQAKRVGQSWKARCPAHDDRDPSLTITEGREGRVLLRCQSQGCRVEDIVLAAGKSMADLFDDVKPNGNGNGHKPEIVATYDYTDEAGALLFQSVRFLPKDFRQRRPDGRGGWEWKLGDTRRVLYRLPEVLAAAKRGGLAFVVEGEKDADRLAGLGYTATTNAGGAGKWRDEYREPLRGAHVVILPDNDAPGRAHAEQVATSLVSVVKSVKVVVLPGLPPKGDVSDWFDRGGTLEQLDHLLTGAPLWTRATDKAEMPIVGSSLPADQQGVRLADFYAYMPMHAYIFAPSRETWPGSSVNARIPPIPTGRPNKKGEEELESASAWLDRHQSVEQMTWAPGEPMLIEGRLISHGGWIERPGCRCFNLYRGPLTITGNSSQAGPWLEHVRTVYPTDAEHIVSWLAHRVQRPHEKINHALVLGGAQGIGKDSLLEPVKHAVGPWNFEDVGPTQIMGRFNGFVKSVILRVSEARDLGDVNRYAFYDHMKSLTAAPPDVLRVDEKHLREYAVFNVTGVIVTTNHKADGIYLPADDRRHYVAWSDLSKDTFAPDYWTTLYRWYANGGAGHVTAYLRQVPLDTFDPKAPPPKTAAFWDIVAANTAPEDAELADALERMDNPEATTLSDVAERADSTFGDWLRDRRNSRAIPHRFEEVGYTAVRNGARKDGLWIVKGKRQVVYARKELTVRDRIVAARRVSQCYQ